MSYEFILVILACFMAGFVDSIAGGGGLISVPTMLFIGLPSKAALATNKLIGITSSFASTLQYALAKKIQWKVILPAVFWALLGGAVGAMIARSLDNGFLKPLIIVLLFLVAVYSLFNKKFISKDTADFESLDKNKAFALWGIGFFMGAYDGFFGPGTGTFLMILLCSYIGMPLINASANARLINLASNMGSLIVFFQGGLVNVKIAFAGAVASALGAFIGARMSIKKGVPFIKIVFNTMVWALLLKLSYDLLFG